MRTDAANLMHAIIRGMRPDSSEDGRFLNPRQWRTQRGRKGAREGEAEAATGAAEPIREPGGARGGEGEALRGEIRDEATRVRHKRR